MKHLYFLFLLLTVTFYCKSQNCRNFLAYEEKKRIADSCVSAGNFSFAQINYNVARYYCEDSLNVIEKAKDDLFSKIDSLRISAEIAKTRADSLKNVALINSKSNQLLGLANEHREKNSKLALLLANKALEINPNNSLAQRSRADIYVNNPVPEETFMHLGTITTVNIYPIENKVLTGGSDGIFKLWNFDGTLVKTFDYHDSSISSSHISYDGQYVVSGDQEGKVIVWNIKGEILFEKTKNSKINSVEFSRDNKKILFTDKDNVFLWKFENEEEKQITNNDSYTSLNGASFSPSCDTILVTDYADIWLYDTIGQELNHFDTYDYDSESKKRENGDCVSIFQPVKNRILSGSYNGYLIIYDLKGNLINETKAHEDYINSIAVSENGEMIVTASKDNNIIIYDSNGNIKRKFQAHTDNILDIDVSPNGSYILTCSKDWKSKLWKKNNTHIKQEKTDFNLFKILHIPDSENYIIADGTQKNIVIIDQNFTPINKLKVPNQNNNFNYVKHLAISKNAEFIASSLDNQLSIWNKKGEMINTFSDHSAEITSIYLLTNDRIISTDASGKIILRDFISGKVLHQKISTYPITCANISSDEKYFATGLYLKNEVQVWKLDNKNISIVGECTGHNSKIQDISFIKNRAFLTASFDGRVKMWNIKGEELFSIDAHKNDVNCVDYSHHRDLIATSSGKNNEVIVWDMKGNLVCNYSDLNVSSIDFSNDGNSIVIASHSGEITILELINSYLERIDNNDQINYHQILLDIDTSYLYEGQLSRENYQKWFYSKFYEGLNTNNVEDKLLLLNDAAYYNYQYILNDTLSNILNDTSEFIIINKTLSDSEFITNEFESVINTIKRIMHFYNSELISKELEVKLFSKFLISKQLLGGDIEFFLKQYESFAPYEKYLFTTEYQRLLNLNKKISNRIELKEVEKSIFENAKSDSLALLEQLWYCIAFLENSHLTVNNTRKKEYINVAYNLYNKIDKSLLNLAAFEVIQNTLDNTHFKSNMSILDDGIELTEYKTIASLDDENKVKEIYLDCLIRQLNNNPKLKNTIVEWCVNLSHSYMKEGIFDKAKNAAQEGIKFAEEIDLDKNSHIYISLIVNLAHSYLYSDNYKEAKDLYGKVKNKEVSGSFGESSKKVSKIIIQDFEEYKRDGVSHPNVDKIKKYIE